MKELSSSTITNIESSFHEQRLTIPSLPLDGFWKPRKSEAHLAECQDGPNKVLGQISNLSSFKSRRKGGRVYPLGKRPIPTAFDLLNQTLANGRGFTKMTLFHCHSPATGTDIFHGRQFILAHMGVINLGGATETALACIPTGVAQMPRLLRYRATILTSVCHKCTPFPRKAIPIQAKRSDFINTRVITNWKKSRRPSTLLFKLPFNFVTYLI
jgi:hypothetical protein